MHLYNDRRTVLLIDQDTRKQRLRATVLRGFEVEVHSAGDMERAESLWKTGSYDLILVAAEENADESYLLSARIRMAKPDQRIALLVGPPAYIRELPGAAKPARHPSEARNNGKVPLPPPVPGLDGVMPAQWQHTIQKVVADWYSHKIAV
jgi:hypothetical protein